MPHEFIRLEIIAGVEGPSVYLNDYRIAGPKPWGGGRVIQSFKVRPEDLETALERAGFKLGLTKDVA